MRLRMSLVHAESQQMSHCLCGSPAGHGYGAEVPSCRWQLGEGGDSGAKCTPARGSCPGSMTQFAAVLLHCPCRVIRAGRVCAEWL